MGFFMPSDKEQGFSWEKGQVINDANSDHVAPVRAKGLTKIKDAVAADPVQRKKQREDVLKTQKAKTYKSQADEHVVEDESVISEGSQSGLSSDVEESVAKKLIDHNRNFRGVDRFGKTNKSSDPKDEK